VAITPRSGALTPSSGRLLELLELVRNALGVDATVSVRTEGETTVGTFHGRDVGLVIGKHGQTIDAIQYLANAVLSRSEPAHSAVVVDAAGYRTRRRATLEGLAERVAAEVASTGQPCPLEPMTPAERKIVHLHLSDRPGVTTTSEGIEPSRYVVVHPAE
jgi:spoIIIJ-associated protein